jgi:hypothetical protein
MWKDAGREVRAAGPKVFGLSAWDGVLASKKVELTFGTNSFTSLGPYETRLKGAEDEVAVSEAGLGVERVSKDYRGPFQGLRGKAGNYSDGASRRDRGRARKM